MNAWASKKDKLCLYAGVLKCQQLAFYSSPHAMTRVKYFDRLNRCTQTLISTLKAFKLFMRYIFQHNTVG